MKSKLAVIEYTLDKKNRILPLKTLTMDLEKLHKEVEKNGKKKNN